MVWRRSVKHEVRSVLGWHTGRVLSTGLRSSQTPMKHQGLTAGEAGHHLDGVTLAELLAYICCADANLTAAASSGTIFIRAPCRCQFVVLAAYLSLSF